MECKTDEELVRGFLLALGARGRKQRTLQIYEESIRSSGSDYADPSWVEEVVKIDFDPTVISYAKLLEVFFKTHDPTTLNRQGADKGTRYPSIVLYINEEQRKQAASFIAKLNTSGMKVVTVVVSFNKFYEAEEEHKDFYKENSGTMYCQIVIQPKVDKVREEFSEHISLV